MGASAGRWGQGRLGYDEFSHVITLLAARMQATPLQMAHALLEIARITSDSTCSLEQALEALNVLAAQELPVARSLELLPGVLERIGAGATPEQAVTALLPPPGSAEQGTTSAT